MERQVDFLLPVGYLDDKGDLHRAGKIRLATAMDEIEIHNDDKVYLARYHDILLLSKVITKLGDLPIVDIHVIEDLYEVDFRYLQTLYKEINGYLEKDIQTICPKCNTVNTVNLSRVYENLDFYFRKDQEEEAETEADEQFDSDDIGNL